MKIKKVGFIGLGIMGKSMARNLKKAGFDVRVFNRSSASVTELQQEGFLAEDSPKALAEYADAVLICVTDGTAEKALLFGENGVAHAQNHPEIVVDFSTVSPVDARSISETLSVQSIRYLDAPVSGGDIGARNGTLTIMVGGERDDFQAMQPVFNAVGKNIFHTGPVGNGQLTKCVNQVVAASTVAAMTEGLAFAKVAGLDMQQALEVISGGAAGSWSLSNYGPRVLAGDLSPGFDARHMLKDLDFALDEAQQQGLALPNSKCVRALYEELCAKAEAEGAVLGNHGLIRLYES